MLVQHELTQNNLLDRIFVCETPQKYNEVELFMKWLVTSGRKLIARDSDVWESRSLWQSPD